MRSILTFLLFLALAGPSLASDGVLEINQACAVQTGCFAGDTPGFPVTIDGSAGSSYLLTGDLTIPDENTSGVTIDADFITVDLGGHRVMGPVTCSGTPTVCAPTGTGRGVFSGPNTGVRIRNGSVIGMGDHGIGTNAGGSIEDVIASQNAGVGIFLGPASSVDRSQAASNGGDGIVGTNWVRVSNSASVVNGGDGIVVGEGSEVSANRVHQNAGTGITAAGGVLTSGISISGNQVGNNGTRGIFAGSAATVTGNTCYGNTSEGIFVSFGSTVIGNSVYQNGGGINGQVGATISQNTVRDNTGTGIIVADGLIDGNAVSGNGSHGLNMGSESGYRGNVMIGNSPAVFGGVNTGGNVCDGAICP